jgi:hypothetical protein
MSMADETPRRIFLGVLPSGADVFVGEGQSDPVARLISEANAEFDRQRAAEPRAVAAKAADVEREKATRSARTMRRFKRMLKMFARLR